MSTIPQLLEELGYKNPQEVVDGMSGDQLRPLLLRMIDMLDKDSDRALVEMRETSIDELELLSAAEDALRKENINTLADLLKFSEERLLGISIINYTHVAKIKATLGKYGKLLKNDLSTLRVNRKGMASAYGISSRDIPSTKRTVYFTVGQLVELLEYQFSPIKDVALTIDKVTYIRIKDVLVKARLNPTSRAKSN